MEQLEDRTLLSVSSTFVRATGTLLVATDTSDPVAITAAAGQVLINGANPQTGPLSSAEVLSISVIGGQGANNIDLSGVLTADFTALVAIDVNGNDGSDTITASPFGGTYNGGHGSDVITGSSGDDIINGDDGHDTIDGGDGADSILGEDGNDVLDGGTGDDTVDGDNGNDSINGGDGDDSLLGGDDSDTINGGAGADTLNGGFSDDTLDGGADDDVLFGGADDDSMLGSDGNDRLVGNAGEDTLLGGDGDDTVLGGVGNDSADGGAGNDVLQGDAGADTLDGNAGDDFLIGDDGNGHTSIGDDVLLGGDGADTLQGGPGQDSLNGGADNDCLQGNAGDDTLIGGGGADTMDGGTGDDFVASVETQISLTVTPATVSESEDDPFDIDGSEAVFTITLSQISGQTVTVDFATTDGTATAGSDYVPQMGTLTFLPGETVKTVTVPIIDDIVPELDETFFLNLSNPTGAALANTQAQVTIVDDDVITVAIDNFLPIIEGDMGTTFAQVTVFLSHRAIQTMTVDFATADGTATAGQDYQAVSGTLTFMPGQSVQAISVPIIGDTTIEPDEAFFVNLFNPTGGLMIFDAQGEGVILNDDPTLPALSINDVSVTEGNAGTTNVDFTVTLSAPSTFGVTVDFATANGTATAGSDYQAAAGIVQFLPGQTTKTLTVSINGDNSQEPDETFFVNLSNVVGGAIIADGQGIGTILNDDGVTVPALTIDDVSVTEGNTGTTTADFTVTLSQASGMAVMVDFATANGTATAGQDYVAANGTLTIPAGQTTGTISVTINGDTTQEPNETYFVNLSNAVGATIADNQGLGTILDDDGGAEPSITINDVSVTEGNTGTTTADFTVTLSQASGTAVTVDFATADGTATAGQDYVAANGTLTIPAGQTTGTISVTINGDTTQEPDETYFVNLSNATGAVISDNQGLGTITNDDGGGGLPTLSINDVAIAEGNTGTTTADFTVTLSQASGMAVTVDFATANGTATAGQDYVAANGTLTIPAGQTTGTISVTINGDTTQEPDETYFVNLSNAMGATIADNQGLGTITNDDGGGGLPTLSINDVAIAEGNTGTSTADFTVTLSQASGMAVTVDFATANGTATAGQDYVAANGTLTIPAGQTTGTISVTINGDTTQEPDETYFVNLSNAMGATIADNQGMGTINNDDGGTAPAYDIEVVFMGGLTPTQEAIFTMAEQRWEQIIIGDVPDVNVPGIGLVDDIRIAASGVAIDGPGGILGQAGPTMVRPGTFLPVTGIMQFDTADLAALEASGQLVDVILHEMAHVIGSGTIWQNLNLLTGAGGADPRFTGAMATQEYNNIFMNTDPDVPVENMGGPGTADAHWRESLFNVELMTGFLNAGVTNPISRVTVAQFADLGYQVDITQADPFVPLQAPPDMPPAVKMPEVTRPQMVVLQEADMVSEKAQVSVRRAQLAPVTALDPMVTLSVYDTGGTLDTAQSGGLWGLEVDPAGGTVYVVGGGVGNQMQFIASTGLGTAVIDETTALTHPGRGIDLTELNGDYYVAANQTGTGGGVFGFTPGGTGLTTFATRGGANWQTSGLTFDAAGTEARVTSDSGVGHHSLQQGATSSTLIVDASALPQGYGAGADDHTIATDGRLIIFTDIGGRELVDCTGGPGNCFALADVSALDVGAFGSRIATDPVTGDFFIGFTQGGTSIFRVSSDGSTITTFADGFIGGVRDLDFGPASSGMGISLYATETATNGVGTIYEFIFSPQQTMPEASIDDVQVFEGDVGTTAFAFTVSLDVAPTQAVSVDFATADGTATLADNDYQQMMGTVTFMPGQTSQTVTILVNGDLIVEADETFFVNLSNPNGLTILDGQGQGLILNDDSPLPPDLGDILLGSDGNDTLVGGTGDDLLDGGAGDDLISGGGGDDTIRGGAGKDTIVGGDGDDVIDGGQSTDSLTGGMGNDTFTWETGDGSDNFDGGLGFDTLEVNTLTHNDRITVSNVGDGRFSVHHRIPSDAVGQTVRGGMIEVLAIDSNGGADRITVEDLTGVTWLQRVEIDAGRGSDLVDASAQLNPNIQISVLGGAGADTVIGGVAGDTIDGQEGNDSLTGGGGNDTIDGGDGVDKIFGSNGNDLLRGGNNRDFVFGENGDDTIDGGAQNDDLFGGEGHDSISGNDGDDSILGEGGHDTLLGGAGADTLRGGAGNDDANGEDGQDSIDGGDGDDTLRGGADNDTVVGKNGNDLLFGGIGSILLMADGNDFLNGNAGNDTIDGEFGDDSLLGGAGHDEIDGGFGNDQLNGNAGNDSMRGGHGNDLMRGGMGNDTLNGGHGEDRLFGQGGNDGLSGHDGHDRVNGGGGADTLHGGDGNDTLRGGAGLDLLIGHDGNDNLNGQGGDPDTLVGQDAFDILDDNGGVDVKDNDFVFIAAWIDAA